MKSDVNGCSTCPAGQEQYEWFSSPLFSGNEQRVQYDYRHTDGKLFSCVAPTLEAARQKRDKWLDHRTLLGEI